jgi:hypothetical protein
VLIRFHLLPILCQVVPITGFQGLILGNDGLNDNVLFHETGHLLGLSDRYQEKGKSDAGERLTEPFDGFGGDLMGAKENRKLTQVHYDNWGKFATKMGAGTLTQRVDIDREGYIIGGKERIQIVK